MGQIEANGLNPTWASRPLRESIQPTYNRRETGDRYSVEYRVSGRVVGHQSIADPFVRGTVRIKWRDLLRGLFKRELVVEVTVSADSDLINDVMELDGDCLVPHSTRQRDFRDGIEKALGRLAMEPQDEELN